GAVRRGRFTPGDGGARGRGRRRAGGSSGRQSRPRGAGRRPTARDGAPGVSALEPAARADAAGPPKSSPLVTAVVCTWNRAHLVSRALASIRAQTVTNVEILVVDDGSTDATPEVLSRLAAPRLRILRHAQNAGI